MSGLSPPTKAGPSTIDPPNHKYHTFTIADLVRVASDGCSRGLGVADVVIAKVSSDEPDNGCGDGNTTRSISMHVTDAAGNRTNAIAKVMVPPNGRSNTAVDDGPRFTVPSNCP